MHTDAIFNISDSTTFNQVALSVFNHQYQNNAVYREFCNHLKRNPKNVLTVSEIPFLPIQFFKSHTVKSTATADEIIFTSSGTTGSITSKHHVPSLALYQESYLKGFTHFYGAIEEYCVLALLPSYLEREGSSLIYMAEDFIKRSNHEQSGFYLNDLDGLKNTLVELEEKGIKTLLLGVSFALLDLIEMHNFVLTHTIVMETGGMKGRRKEMIREELHHTLSQGFGTQKIHSEYGMTELLSQGYSKGDGLFFTPPWMQISIRDTEDPLQLLTQGKTGGINVIDLANFNSCSFIATQDLGKVHPNGSFEVLGRFDHSDIRGCNLMVM